MSTEKIFGAMKAGDWEMVMKEIVVTISWTQTDLEMKHGVGTELLMI